MPDHSIAFASTTEDHAYVLRRYAELNPRGTSHWPRRLSTAALGAAALYLLFPGAWQVKLAVALCGGLWAIWVWPRFFKQNLNRAIERAAAKSNAAETEYSIGVSKAGLSVTTETHTGLVPWSAIEAIEPGASVVEFRHSDGNLTFVPIRAFESPSAAQDFARVAQQFWHESSAGAGSAGDLP